VSEAHPITFRLKAFNAWRRGNEAPQPDPKTVGEDIDSICDIAKRLEIERDELREHLKSQRALADRLHGALDALDYNLAFAENTLIGGLRERVTAMRAIALPAIAAWKEARDGSR
jgi:hypothetical protein